ncbi:hypothetical protein [Vibrio sp. S9_S30]|uniref:hypothetical protein n=1 Tax=Vibrio sp. S9_S30 TaxID=2720226 RepID=UPI001EED1ECC|nr:hypothetical protein [Vibrio sp. S9_S30]
MLLSESLSADRAVFADRTLSADRKRGKRIRVRKQASTTISVGIVGDALFDNDAILADLGG